MAYGWMNILGCSDLESSNVVLECRLISVRSVSFCNSAENNRGLGGIVRYSGEHKGGHFVHLALPRRSCIRKPAAIPGQVHAPQYTQLY